MKGRLLAATFVLALTLVVDIGVSRWQSPAGPEPEPPIPELRAGPLLPPAPNATEGITGNTPPAGPEPEPAIPELRAGPLVPAAPNATDGITDETPAAASDSAEAESSSPVKSPVVDEAVEPAPVTDTSVEPSKINVLANVENA